MIYTLPELPYDYRALEPHIDARTMEIHHGKHHAAYVNNLNGAIDKHPALFDKTIEELIADLGSVPEDIRTAVRNNGGGYVNHSFFWPILKKDVAYKGDIAEAINAKFGGLEKFQETFAAAAAGQALRMNGTRPVSRLRNCASASCHNLSTNGEAPSVGLFSPNSIDVMRRCSSSGM